MSDPILDRIEQLKKGNLPARLGKGMEILAQLWRTGTRCKDGWRGSCSCAPAPTQFCQAKAKWIRLLQEFHGGYPYGLTGAEECFVIEAMSLSMVKISGIKILVEVPGARKPIKFGGDREEWDLLPELAAMDEDNRPAFLETVILMQEKL